MGIFSYKCSGEANFLGGVASVKGVKGFDPEGAKKRFFEIYLDKVVVDAYFVRNFVHMVPPFDCS